MPASHSRFSVHWCVILFHFRPSRSLSSSWGKRWNFFYCYLLRQEEYLQCKFLTFFLLEWAFLFLFVCLKNSFSVLKIRCTEQSVTISLSFAVSFFMKSDLLSFFFRFASPQSREIFVNVYLNILLLHLNYNILYKHEQSYID